MFAAERDVAGQPAKRKVETAGKQQHRADKNNNAAKKQQNFSQVGHQINGRDAATRNYAAF